MEMATTIVAEQLHQTRNLVAQAAARFGRLAPRILAVSKLHPPSALQDAYGAGQRRFGENYVQELVEKAPQLPNDIHWHFIGHLQTNKCRTLLQVRNLDVIEGLDSLKVADKLQAVCEELGRTVKVLVQVRATKGSYLEDSKQIVHHVVENCRRLVFCGLMSIGNPDLEVAKVRFEEVRKLREELLTELAVKWKDSESTNGGFIDQEFLESGRPRFPRSCEEFELSMGMSGDLELAVESGSTEVRIGTAIFGARDYSKK